MAFFTWTTALSDLKEQTSSVFKTHDRSHILLRNCLRKTPFWEVLPGFHQLACLIADKQQQTAIQMPFTNTKYIAVFASEVFEPLNKIQK